MHVSESPNALRPYVTFSGGCIELVHDPFNLDNIAPRVNPKESNQRASITEFSSQEPIVVYALFGRDLSVNHKSVKLFHVQPPKGNEAISTLTILSCRLNSRSQPSNSHTIAGLCFAS